MLILSRPRNIASGLSTNRACMVGAMTEGNIPDTDRVLIVFLIVVLKLLLYLFPGYIKNLPTST